MVAFYVHWEHAFFCWINTPSYFLKKASMMLHLMFKILMNVAPVMVAVLILVSIRNLDTTANVARVTISTLIKSHVPK